MKILETATQKFLALFSAIFITVAGGAAVFHTLEGWSWLDCFYFAVTTITTVGYGDLHPTKPLTKIFIMFYIFIGVAIAYYTLNALGQYWMERRQGLFARGYNNVRDAVNTGREHGRRLRHHVRKATGR